MRRSFAAITALACLVAPASVLAENAYITNLVSANVSVIDTATNTVIATIPVGIGQNGVAVTPDGSKVYVTNVQLPNPSVVSVIATATNTVIATIPLGGESNGVAVTRDGRKVYVANSGSNNVFVIDTASNLVLAVVSVGIQPVAFGAFIRQPPFAGTPREPGCHGKSVSALAEQFGGLPAAATARGFSSVPALQDAINVFCRGAAAAG